MAHMELSLAREADKKSRKNRGTRGSRHTDENHAIQQKSEPKTADVSSISKPSMRWCVLCGVSVRVWCVVCLCACGVLCVWQGRAGKEREERRGKKKEAKPENGSKMNETTGYKKHWEICQNKGSFLGAIWSAMDTKTVQQRSFFTTHCFFTLSWDLRTFSAEGPIPNAQICVF